MLDRIEMRELIRSELEALAQPPESPTVNDYAKKWLATRYAHSIASADDDSARLREHVLPEIGEKRLSEIRARDLYALVQKLEEEGLAPRTILNTYGVLRVMFSDAVREEVIHASPCILQARRRELPKKRDKDPRWRSGAVFEREEVERLLTDPRIPFRRRTLYALELLGAMRVNEITPRRWFDLQPSKPLWKLTIHSGYDPKHRIEKTTPKSGFIREMPVHPALLRYLEAWRDRGWMECYGHDPGPSDLILPAVDGGFLSSSSSWKRLQEDLDVLGLRHRRQHDARRTFITLARTDGAQKDLLHWVTHGPEGDIMDCYTQPPWPVLCEQVARLKIKARPNPVGKIGGKFSHRTGRPK